MCIVFVNFFLVMRIVTWLNIFGGKHVAMPHWHREQDYLIRSVGKDFFHPHLYENTVSTE